ncbi:MAG: glycosyltransferase family 4 protein [Chloroflexi bacterium]|nr:glycosyltransferase family 4 protein [Chloroflexota bacterium]
MNAARQPAVVLVGSQMSVGGAQRVLLDQANWFQAHGWRVVVVFLYDRDGLQAAWQQAAPFPIVNLLAHRKGGGKMENAVALLAGFGRLLRLLWRERPAGVETFTHHANLVAIPAAWLAGVPRRVATHHGVIQGFSPVLERLHTLLVNSGMATRLVVVSPLLREQSVQAGVQPGRIAVIPNGVAVPRINPQAVQAVRHELGDGDPLVLTVGRLVEQKSQTFFLQAAVHILERFPGAVFALAGDGPLRAGLEAEAQRLGIPGRVRFLGTRQDTDVLMAAADVLVLSSRSEGLPMVLLESMAAGTPVVATRVGGVGALVKDGENGLLVPAEDVPALAAAVCRLLEQPQERRRLVEAGRRCVLESFTREQMCLQYESLLDPRVDRKSSGNKHAIS